MPSAPEVLPVLRKRLVWPESEMLPLSMVSDPTPPANEPTVKFVADKVP
jgi:hypothetical protein